MDSVVGLSAVQIYNAVSDTWTGGTNLRCLCQHGRWNIETKLFISDVSTFFRRIDANDPTIITWTAADDYPAGYSILTSGALYFGCWFRLSRSFQEELRNTQVRGSVATFAYDVNANQWKVGPPKPTAAQIMSMVCSSR
ncbi:MAG: hypothetical protein IPP46_14200 [Bacteroidetes bacterium]|nr:hypothetical protein [Bacteroidota bacterium]